MGPYRYSGLDRLLLILLVAGIALRFVQLGAKEFWHDEAYTLFNAAGLTPYGQEREYAFTHADLETRNTASGVVQACLRNDGGNGILHAMLMHGWLAMAPNSTAWLRMPSAVLGLGAILLTMAMVRDLFGGRRTSLLAGTLAAWNTLLLQGSMDLRGYTLATVLALGSTWLLCRILLDRKGRWNYTFYAAFALMGLLVHYTTLYVLLAHGIMAVLYARGWSKCCLLYTSRCV